MEGEGVVYECDCVCESSVLPSTDLSVRALWLQYQTECTKISPRQLTRWLNTPLLYMSHDFYYLHSIWPENLADWSWTSELPTWLPTCQNSAKLNFAQVWVYFQPSQDALKFVMLLSTPSSAMRWVILVQRVRSCWSDTERMSFVSLSRITHDSCVTIKYLCVAIASNWAGWTLCENFHSSFSLIPRLPQPGNDTNHPYHDNFWIEMLFYIITVEPLQLAWWNL